MPTYEYECLDCGKRFEEFQFISEPAIEKCIYCNGKAQRLVSAGAGLIFKCGGFYITDSKKTDYSNNHQQSTAANVEPSATKSETAVIQSTQTTTATSNSNNSTVESKSKTKTESNNDTAASKSKKERLNFSKTIDKKTKENAAVKRA